VETLRWLQCCVLEFCTDVSEVYDAKLALQVSNQVRWFRPTSYEGETNVLSKIPQNSFF
jgi:hypothetical protein